MKNNSKLIYLVITAIVVAFIGFFIFAKKLHLLKNLNMKTLKTKFFSLILISLVLLINGCTETVDFDGSEIANQNQFILDFDALNVIKKQKKVLQQVMRQRKCLEEHHLK